MNFIRASRGFTLLEMVITLILLGVLSVFLATRWPGEHLTIHSQAEQLLNDIRYIQALAMNQNQGYLIAFSNNRYAFKTAMNLPVPHPLTGESTIHLPQGMMIQTDRSILLFNYMGTPFVGSLDQPLTDSTQITLAHGQENKIITIYPETGYAQFQN